MADVAAILPNTLRTLLTELIDGPPGTECYMLNPGDRGLLRSLDDLSAAAASARPGGRASIASHVDHLRYGLSLMNRWQGGEANPWADADWTASWKRQVVSDDEWVALRQDLGTQARKWQRAIAQANDLEGVELNGAIGSIAHLAYHFGAIRQIDRSLRGPSAEQAAS